MIEGTPARFIGDRYHIVRELGRGGMGVVYLGRDLRLDMDVAIKFRGLVHAEATLWLKREFRAVASLRHRNLVELYELVAHEQSCYFTMEYLAGTDPRDWVDQDRQVEPDRPTATTPPLDRARTQVGSGESTPPSARPTPRADFGRVRSVLAQLAEGLAFLHARGVIHRDVKPSNAIVVDGSVKLLDFGLALERHRQDDDLARENRIVGTTAYLAPEYLSRLVVSPAMDVYALGVLAFELCTGGPPFGGTMHLLSRLHRTFAVPRASSLNPEVPADLDELIAMMLGGEPEQRPTALDVAARLTGQLSQPHAAPRELRFFGRGVELEQIASRIADPEPRGRLVLVTGPSGAGKTALIDEALHRARGRLTWRSRCHERERVPYRAFDQIVDDLAAELASDPELATAIEHPGALGRVFPALAVPFDDDPIAADLRVERERALLAMIALLGRIVRTAPAVVAIDDLQWADGDSLELLALVIERIGKPVTVIVSWTTDTPVPVSLAALAALTIPLAAMTDDDLAHLIGDLAPLASGTQLVAAARLAAGSPYLAEMIGRELGASNIALSDSGEGAETRRLDRLTRPEREVAELAALAGGASTFEQLRGLAALPSGQLHSILRGLEADRIVRATPSASGDPVFVFYHQRLRDAALGAMTDASRRASHERFAMWFETSGGTADQLAYHWHHAGSPARAAKWAETAGDNARDLLAWALASSWYERALEYKDDPALRAKLAEAFFLGGKLAAAATEFQRLDGDQWRVRAAEAYLKLGEIERGLGVLDGVLERRGEKRSTSRALSVLRAAAVGARWLAPLPRRPRPVDAVLASAYGAIASFLSTPHPIEALEYVLRGVDLAERSGDRAKHSMGMAMLAAYLAAGTLGRFGDRAIASAERLATGSPYAEMVAAGCAGILEMLRGDWIGMRASHRSGEKLCHRLGIERSWEASFLRSYWALGELYAGDPARALALLGDTTAEDMWTRAMIGSYRGRAMVLAGDLDGARGLLQTGTLARTGMAAFYHQLLAIELALAEHDWESAAAQCAALERSARGQWLTAMPAVSAMIDVAMTTAEIGRAAGGDRAAASRALATARRIHRRGKSSFYAVTALRLWAQAESLLGHRELSAKLLDRAGEAAARCGGKVDQLAIAALSGHAIDAGPLARAVAWSTGGVLS